MSRQPAPLVPTVAEVWQLDLTAGVEGSQVLSRTGSQARRKLLSRSASPRAAAPGPCQAKARRFPGGGRVSDE